MNKWYLYFDKDYQIISVTNELQKNNFEYFEIDEPLALEFTTGVKSLSSYKVKVTNLSEFALEPTFINSTNDRIVDPRENNDLTFKDIVVLQENISNPNLTITYSKNNWKFSLSDNLKSAIPVAQHEKNLLFFVVNRYDLNQLYRTIRIKIKDLITSDCTLNFELMQEHDYSNISILAKPVIDNISVLKND